MILKRNRVAAFSAWLTERGATVLPTERSCELVRFKVGNTLCTITSDGTKGKALEVKGLWSEDRRVLVAAVIEFE